MYLRMLDTEPSEAYQIIFKYYLNFLNEQRPRPLPPELNNNLYLFTLNPVTGGYDTFEMPSRKGVKLENNETFYPSVNHEKLINFVENKDVTNGKILLMYGEPGTGKTTYIRHLISNYGNNNILMFTADMVQHFSKPHFVATLMARFNNSIILIEDAENLIVTRENGKDKNNLLSDFLNLTDGIFGDAANIRVILTFNTKIENIDKAILRKGRLYYKQVFNKLTKDEANRALVHLGKEPTAIDSMSLAEIYNVSEVYE
jgi:SpoVK/Ycf46/Vps4 family AAA+-type ATPase